MRPTAAPLLVLLLAACPAPADFFEGRVENVFDGDSFEMSVDGERRQVRIFGIDSPEHGQPWADRARRALRQRLGGQTVRVDVVATDRYDRTVGEVSIGDVCVACEMLREGHAWVYRKYTEDPALVALENEAREARRGLWGLPQARRLPPWEWRERARKTARAPTRAEEAAGFACGTKRECRQMKSCQEARFHLEVCKLDGIDGDGDGVPCEVLCSH